MAVSFVNAAHASSVSATSLTVAAPTGLAFQDLLLAFVSAPAATITAPSGWALLPGLTASNGTALYYKLATSSETASYVWSFSAAGRVSVITAAYRGVDRFLIYNGTPAWNSSTSATVNWAAVANTRAVTTAVVFADTAANATFTTPASWTLRDTATPVTGLSQVMFERAVTTLNSAGGAGSTASSSALYNAIQITLTPLITEQWTDPRAWTVTQMDTDEIMNVDVRDNQRAAARLIASTSYESGATSVATTSTSLADIDAVNLAVTFTAPHSGAVRVRLTASAQVTGANRYLWAVASGGVTQGAEQAVTDNSGIETCSVDIPVTGLTPGNSYTFTWRHRVTAGTGTTHMSTANGPALLEVWQARH